MTPARFLYPTMLLSLLALTACGEKKQFGAAVANQTQSGKVEGRDQDTTAASPTPPAATETPPIPEQCKMGTANFTKVTLLSKSMSTKPSIQSLKYEVSSLSCKDGKVVPIMNESLFFDLNGKISGQGFPPISYAVNDSQSGNLITQGTLEVVQGSDLFRNTGQYAHWKTNTLT